MAQARAQHLARLASHSYFIAVRLATTSILRVALISLRLSATAPQIRRRAQAAHGSRQYATLLRLFEVAPQIGLRPSIDYFAIKRYHT